MKLATRNFSSDRNKSKKPQVGIYDFYVHRHFPDVFENKRQYWAIFLNYYSIFPKILTKYILFFAMNDSVIFDEVFAPKYL